MIKELLIEIGVEELPAIAFLRELPQIEEKWLSILEKYALTADFEFFYTPRRLVLWHKQFPSAQPDRQEELFGAPVDVSFSDGKPTPAALGFAKKCGVSVDKLERSTKNNREVLYYKSTIKGVQSHTLLADMIREFIAILNFGKSMRWGGCEESFIRPIRWIGVMLGEMSLKFDIFNFTTDSFTYPHRTVSYAPISYKNAADYFTLLRENGVVLYQDAREKMILEQFENIEKIEQVSIQMDADLLAEVVAITEHPMALMGSFDREFLRLPPEVIITSMKEHQRYFPVFKDGILSNNFIVVSNAICEDYSFIIKGNEKVLRARLSDGLFFYDNDLRNGLSFAELKDVVYLDGLGSVFDKVIREKNIVEYLDKKYQLHLAIKIDDRTQKQISNTLNRAIMLSKADLLSEMVYEFTELQGLMGYYYAKAAGEDDLVALALREQYLPDSQESALPSNIFSSIIALCNKIDSLIALFSIGKIPTGTKDPYALRRAVNGIVRIVLHENLAFDIARDLKSLSKNYASFDFTLLENFFIERIYKIFDVNPSIIKAVLQTNERDIVTLSKKIKALGAITSSSDFKEVFGTFKRVANIIKDLDIDAQINIDEALFETSQERALYKDFKAKASKKYPSYESQLDALFGLKPKIDDFFDNVMVNADDENIAQNRQNLIALIYREFKSIADIKEISVS